MRRKKPALTEADWAKVFLARCKTKQGQQLSEEERALVNVAFKLDAKRYGEMEKDVFNATVPLGSNARWKDES